MGEADAVGIDAPFGWPDDFTAAVHGWATTGAWPRATEPTRMRHRETDRVVHHVLADAELARLWPLSVSSDRIAVCAWRCAGLLSAHAERAGRPVDRVGASPEDSRGGAALPIVLEVYPAAALSMWGLPYKGYKGSAASRVSQRGVREKIVELLLAKADWLTLDEATVAACVADDDRLDAVIASLVARAAALGRTLLPDQAQIDAAQREGWVHLPAADAIFDLNSGAAG